MVDRVAEGWGQCPTCQREFERVTRHWDQSGCPRPQPEAGDHALLAGFALGGASAYGNVNAKLKINTTQRELALWVHETLGWLSGGVTREEPKEWSRNEQPQYVVRTLAHPALNRYWGWAGGGVPPDTLELTQPMARCWFALAGGLVFDEWPGSAPTLQLKARSDEARLAGFARLLRGAGFDVSEGADAVIFSRDEAARWLRWVGEPIPGAEHKWATQHAVSKHLRKTHPLRADDDQATCYRKLLVAVAEATGEGADLSRGRFDAAFGTPSASEIADYLGGGSWPDAKRVADVRGMERQPPGTTPSGTVNNPDGGAQTPTSECEGASRAVNRRSGPGRGTYLAQDCKHALRRVAEHLDTEEPSTRDYSSARWEAEPSLTAIYNALSDGANWTEAVTAAGLSAAGPEKRSYTDDDCERALDLCAEEFGEELRKSDCREYLAGTEGMPTPSTIANRLGDGYWAAAVERAGYRAGRQGRTGPPDDRGE